MLPVTSGKNATRAGLSAALVGGLISWILVDWSLDAPCVTMAANLGAVEAGVVQMDWAIWDAVYIGSIRPSAVSVLLMITVSLATQKKRSSPAAG